MTVIVEDNRLLWHIFTLSNNLTIPLILHIWWLLSLLLLLTLIASHLSIVVLYFDFFQSLIADVTLCSDLLSRWWASLFFLLYSRPLLLLSLRIICNYGLVWFIILTNPLIYCLLTRLIIVWSSNWFKEFLLVVRRNLIS